MAASQDRRTLFVPYTRRLSDYSSLEADFGLIGKVVEVKRKHDYAFVTFQDENSVERALNDRWILEKYQNVQRRIPKRRRDWRVDVPRTPQDYQVYLEGIPPETSQRDIEDWVYQLGRIIPLECVILHDQRFVRLKYASADEAEYAARGMDRKLYIGCALNAYVNQQVLDNIAPQRPGQRQLPERRPR